MMVAYQELEDKSVKNEMLLDPMNCANFYKRLCYLFTGNTNSLMS